MIILLTVWRGRYKLVKEALRERKYFLNTAPHLSQWLPIMVPVQKLWQAPYFWAGCKAYDFLAGSEGIESSYFLTKSKAIDAFPMLKRENVVGAMVYYGKSQNTLYPRNWRMGENTDLLKMAHTTIPV
jgi:glycerol-3-phosphate dehydrogenase